MMINPTSVRPKTMTSGRYAAAKIKMDSNVLFYTHEANREIAEIHNMISDTMSRLEKLQKPKDGLTVAFPKSR